MSIKKYAGESSLRRFKDNITTLVNTATNNIYDILFSSTDYFNVSTSYAVGDYTVYNNKLYKCTVAHTGRWNASHFVQSSIFEE